MHLYKQKTSRFWWVQLYGPDGNAVYKSTKQTVKREAKKVAEDLAAEMRREASKETGLAQTFQDLLRRAANDAEEGVLTLERTEALLRRAHQIANPDYHRVTLDEHLEAWIEGEAVHVAGKTVEIYTNVRSLMARSLGKKTAQGPIDQVTTPMVQKALNKINKDHADSYTNLILRAFRRMMEAAVQQGLIASNPAGPQIRPFKERDSTRKEPFTREEFSTLLSFTREAYEHDEWFGLILIGGHTGLRLGDILGLTSKNVHKGNLVVKSAKTGETVTIPLTPPVYGWTGKKKGSFFPLLSSKTIQTISGTFTRIMDRAGVEREVETPGGDVGRRSFHSLRHSFASWLANADVHADVRKKLTGHKADGIHARYTHLDEALSRAVENLPGVSEKKGSSFEGGG